ncbi:MAG: response regulator [Vicinamibacteria bacterium]|nr:response regulator [Vicinamibacteria bacterium]
MKKKILIVDDSKTSIFMVKTILRGGSYELLEANDGLQAVEKTKAALPDLVLMDMMMPNMGGLDALREIRKTRMTQDIPVIMVTTKSESGSVEKAFEIGCSGYVTKPINQVVLLARVRQLLA